MKSIKQRMLALLESNVTDVKEISKHNCSNSQQVKKSLSDLQQQENIQTMFNTLLYPN